jgi:signal transduction histidine kinase
LSAWDGVAGLALAAFMAGLAPVVAVTQVHARPVSVTGVVLLVCCGVALGGRRVWPLASSVVMVGCAVVYLGLRYAGWPVYLGAFAGLVVLVSGVDALRVWGSVAAAGGAGVVVGTGIVEGWQPLPLLVVAAAWAVVAMLGARQAGIRRRWLEEEAERRKVEERLRIARELHDVLSHSLASISLQAGVGLHLLDRQPEQARAALGAIRQSSTAALAQARAALSAVRGSAARQAPAPGLADLPELVRSTAASGLRVEWDGQVDDVTVDDRVATTAYRVLQEALTNAMRHAGSAARVSARVRLVDGWLQLDVTDDGAGAGQPRGSGGHGLQGMAERVQEVGGQLSAGPLIDGGFAVRAPLPAPGR